MFIKFVVIKQTTLELSGYIIKCKVLSVNIGPLNIIVLQISFYLGGKYKDNVTVQSPSKALFNLFEDFTFK